MAIEIDNDNNRIKVGGIEYFLAKNKLITMFMSNDAVINPGGVNSVFAVQSLPATSYAEVTGVILFKFASAADNGISFTLNPGTGIGNTAVGFSLHKLPVGGEMLEVKLGAALANSTPNLDDNVHCVRFSGIIHNPGGAPITNFQIGVINNNSVQQGVVLTVLHHSYMKYQILV